MLSQDVKNNNDARHRLAHTVVTYLRALRPYLDAVHARAEELEGRLEVGDEGVLGSGEASEAREGLGLGEFEFFFVFSCLSPSFY